MSLICLVFAFVLFVVAVFAPTIRDKSVVAAGLAFLVAAELVKYIP